MPLLLPMSALPGIILFRIISMISRIPRWLFAAFTRFTTSTTNFATLLRKEHSFWCESSFSLGCKVLIDKLGDDLIGDGSHRGISFHHELQEDCPHVIASDPAREVEDVILLTHHGDCLCRVRIGSICVTCRLACAESLILDFPIYRQCAVVDISVVLLLNAPKVFLKHEDFELQLWLLDWW